MALRQDPSVWHCAKFDREAQNINPQIVNNPVSVIRLVQNFTVGNETLSDMTFLSGFLQFNTPSSGTKTLPSAIDALKYLHSQYYIVGADLSDFLHPIVYTLFIQIYNMSINPIDLADSADGTFVLPMGSPLTLPAGQLTSFRVALIGTTFNTALIHLVPINKYP